jgi:hypothetical protein
MRGKMMTMDTPERCPNCAARIHPLDLSDLYRGRKCDCHVCGHELRAAATGAWASVAALLAGTWPWLTSWLFPGVSYLGGILLLAVAAVIVWAAPPGLVAGARWVSIKAKEKTSKPI